MYKWTWMQKSQTWGKLDYKQAGHKRKEPIGQEVYKNILRFILAVRESQSQTLLNVKAYIRVTMYVDFFLIKIIKICFRDKMKQVKHNSASNEHTQMVWIEKTSVILLMSSYDENDSKFDWYF